MDGGDLAPTRFHLARPAVLRIFLGIASVLIFVIAVRGIAASWTYSDEPRRTINDFTGDYVSARAFIKGGNAYGETRELAHRYVSDPKNVRLPMGDLHVRNPHPPAYIMLLSPLAILPYVTARNAWLVLMTLSILLGMGIAARASGATLWTAAIVGIASLVLPAVVLELRIGEVNALIMLALAIAWHQIQKGHPARAGVALGFASAIKIFPLFLLIPLLRARNLKAAFTQLGTAVALTLASTVTLGWHHASELLTKVMPANTAYWLAAPHNLSILAIPFRWLTRSHWNPTAADLRPLAVGLAVVLALFCIAAGATTSATLSKDRFWGAIPWMLLISPLFWYEYTVLCLPLIYLVVDNYIREKEFPPWFVLIAIGFLLVWTFDALPSTGTESPAALLGVFALPTYGLLILGLSDWRLPRHQSFQLSRVVFGDPR